MIINELINNRISNPFTPGIKVNLYNKNEYISASKAAHNISYNAIETVMVGDSYFMTHLGGDNTILSPDQLIEAINILPSLIDELRIEIDINKYSIRPPLLMADLPGGLNSDQINTILLSYKNSGADIVKFEVDETCDLSLINNICNFNMYSAIHIGYTPQSNINKTYGTSSKEISSYKDIIIKSKHLGARCVILERMSEISNTILTKFCLKEGLLPYSIFSGKCAMGGQSLNIWDSVVLPSIPSIFFPPTSFISSDDVDSLYTIDVIEKCFYKLLILTMANVFPPSPRNIISVDEYIEIIEGLDYEYNSK